MRIISATVGPLKAASVNSIFASASGTANTALTLTTSPYVLDTPRRIIITSAGNDTGITFAIVGTDWSGMPCSETLTGATTGQAAQSAYDYASITSITPSGNTASTIQVGTNNVASSRPIFLDEWAFPQCAVQVELTGALATASVRQTLDDPNALTNGYPSVIWANSADASAVGTTTSVMSYFAYAPRMVQLLTTQSSTTSVATIRISQAASSPL